MWLLVHFDFLHLFMLLALMALAASSIPPTARPRSLKRTVSMLNLGIHAGNQFFQHHLPPLVTQATILSKAFFRTSLPESEEAAFAEHFKYVIVSSSLLTDMRVTQDFHLNSPLIHGRASRRESIAMKAVYGGLVAISTASSLIWGTSKIIRSFLGTIPPPSYMYIFSLGAAHVGACFFVYKKHHHSNKRQCHTKTIDSLQSTITLSQKCDDIVCQLLEKIREIDLISQGSTLAPPQSTPAQQDQTTSSSRIADICQQTHSLMLPHLQTFTSILNQLRPQLQEQNLSSLRRMYNVEEPASVDNVDEPTLEKLDHLSFHIRWQQREYLLHLLALDVMNSNYDSTPIDWESVVHVMNEVVQEYTSFSNKLQAILDQCQSYNEGDESTMSEKHADRRALALLNRCDTVEKQLQNIRSKLLLCRCDTRSLISGRDASPSVERIRKRFSSLEQDLSHLLVQWDDSKVSLSDLTSNTSNFTPSPPLSPVSSKRMAFRRRNRHSIRTLHGDDYSDDTFSFSSDTHSSNQTPHTAFF